MRYYFILFISLMAFQVKSQDKIYKRGGDIVLAKIQEIGVDEIKYKRFDEPDGPVYGIEKDRIVKIIFQNGRTESYKSSLKDPTLYQGQSKNALKINFLSPLTGYTQLGYERSLKPGRSIEFNLGIIGLGKNQVIDYYYYQPGTSSPKEYKRDAKGANIGIGYKFIKTPDFINRNIRFAHLLQGSYIKPTLYTGFYSENIIDLKTQIPIAERRTVAYGALMIELGKQWVFSEQFLLDIYFGLGYCVDNIKDNDNNSYTSVSDEYQAHHFNTLRLGTSPGFALSGGLKIGMLLGKQKD
ncbi:MAG: hypothetical protein ACRC2O_08365 [Chitinophagaceae bacterium]